MISKVYFMLPMFFLSLLLSHSFPVTDIKHYIQIDLGDESAVCICCEGQIHRGG